MDLLWAVATPQRHTRPGRLIRRTTGLVAGVGAGMGRLGLAATLLTRAADERASTLVMPVPMRGKQVGIGRPPTAARAEGPPQGADALINQTREAQHSPDGHEPYDGWAGPGPQLLLQVVADYERLSAMLVS